MQGDPSGDTSVPKHLSILSLLASAGTLNTGASGQQQVLRFTAMARCAVCERGWGGASVRNSEDWSRQAGVGALLLESRSMGPGLGLLATRGNCQPGGKCCDLGTAGGF